jgi:hypothetical protein
VLGNHAESVLSVAEAEITPQILLVVHEVKEKETQIAIPMGGIRAVDLKDETKGPVKETISLQRETPHVVEMQKRGKKGVEEARSPQRGKETMAGILHAT